MLLSPLHQTGQYLERWECGRAWRAYHVLKGLLSLLQGKDLGIEHRVDVVNLDRLHHVVHQGLASNKNTSHGTDVVEGAQNGRLALGVGATNKANDVDESFKLDALETLLESAGTTDLDDVIHTNVVRGQSASDLAPVGVRLVVDDVVRSEFLQLLALFFRGGGRNNGGTGRFSKLHTQISFVAPWICDSPEILTCNAKMLTPPVPCTNTVCPGCSGFRPYRAFQLVRPAQVRVLASR